MSNLCLKSEGAQVTTATTIEDRHPPQNVIDGNEKTFWYTTVRHFTVFKCDKSEPKQWDEVWKSGTVDKNQDSLQNTQHDVNLRGGCRFLKLRLDDGWEEFAAVYEIRVEGTASG